MARLNAYRSDVGTVRKNNEDVVWAGDNRSGETMVIACDGLGGHAGGEVASATTLAAFQRAFVAKTFKGASLDEFRAWFNGTITHARMAISDAIDGNDELRTMATTVTGAIVAGSLVYVFNCGDSRTYLISKAGVKPVTIDHNVFNLLREQNADKLTWEKYRGRLHALTASVGAMSDEPPMADVFAFVAEEFDYAVATTDGFSSFVDEKALYDVYKKGDRLDAFVDEMIALAISKESNDNVSLAIVKLHAAI